MSELVKEIDRDGFIAELNLSQIKSLIQDDRFLSSIKGVWQPVLGKGRQNCEVQSRRF